MKEKAKSAPPPCHNNVLSGETLKKARDSGFRRSGVIHCFDMTWQCGHTGDAVEIHGPGGCVKACITCADQLGM